jgi:SAM-dependent methyltransferase
MGEEPTKQRYQGESGRLYHEHKRSIPKEAFPWVARLRAQKIQPYVLPQHVVVEYGVGYGWNLAQLKCQRRIGYDLSEFLEPELQAHGIDFVRTLEPLASAADVVICHHVLEHTPQPIQALKEMGRVLRNQGILLLFVPYEKERRYWQYHPDEPRHHLYSWNAQTLGHLVSDAGFRVRQVALARFGYDRFAAIWSSRLKMGALGFRLIRALVHGIQPGREVRLVGEKS